MGHLLARRDLAIEMGRAGRRQIETINGPAAHYEQTMGVYEQLAPQSASPRVRPPASPASETRA